MKIPYIFIYKMPTMSLDPKIPNSCLVGIRRDSDKNIISYIFTKKPLFKDDFDKEFTITVGNPLSRPVYINCVEKIKRSLAEEMMKIKPLVFKDMEYISVYLKNCSRGSVYSYLACKLFIDGKL